MSQPDRFTCASCGNSYPKGWTDEECNAEARVNFPDLDITDPCEAALVCDDCYTEIMTKAEADGLLGPGWRNAGGS